MVYRAQTAASPRFAIKNRCSRLRGFIRGSTKPAPAWHSPEFRSQAHPEGAGRVRFFEQAGKRILHVDFSKADLPLIREIAAECLLANMSQPPISVLSLVEVREIPFDTDALKIGQELRCQANNSKT
jgi:hypothetical protein